MTFVEAVCALAETGPNQRRNAERLSIFAGQLWKPISTRDSGAAFFRAFTDFLFPLTA